MAWLYVVRLQCVENAAAVETGELGMNRLLLAATALLGLSVVGSANAADMGMPAMPTKAPIVVPPPVFNWTGFYIGGNGGYGWANQSYSGTDTSALGVASFSGSSTASGGLAGGQIGVNYEFPNQWVIGIEADGDWANIAGSASGCATYPSGIVSGCATDSATLNDFGTVRARLGYAWNNVLLYGTGGWAWGNSSATHTTTCVGACPGLPFTGGGASASNSLSGWTAGAGLEWGFLPNWTLRLEYLHLEFDNVATNYSDVVTVNAVPFPITGHISSNIGVDVVRVGLNYLFNWGTAPSAFR
jgi:outer membrane immunogenic protein